MKVSEIQVSYCNSSNDRVYIKSSEDAFKVALSHWNKDVIEFQEEVKMILLNRANRVIGIYALSKGGTSVSVVDIKIVLSVALKCHSTSIILLHNHPSGNLKPSQADINLTEKIKKACDYVDLTLLDHLIISKDEFYSFSDDGGL